MIYVMLDARLYISGFGNVVKFLYLCKVGTLWRGSSSPIHACALFAPRRFLRTISYWQHASYPLYFASRLNTFPGIFAGFLVEIALNGRGL
jgi:hypothetical protein